MPYNQYSILQSKWKARATIRDIAKLYTEPEIERIRRLSCDTFKAAVTGEMGTSDQQAISASALTQPCLWDDGKSLASLAIIP